MLSKIVSLSLVALAAGQVQIEGSPEWQADKNAELAQIAPSVGPVAPVNYAQAELNHVSPSVGPLAPVNHAQSLLLLPVMDVRRGKSRLSDLLSGKHTRTPSLPTLPPQPAPRCPELMETGLSLS